MDTTVDYATLDVLGRHGTIQKGLLEQIKHLSEKLDHLSEKVSTLEKEVQHLNEQSPGWGGVV